MSSNSGPADRVLVLMPTARDTERMGRALAAAGLAYASCKDVAELCRELEAGAGAALLTEEAVVGDRAGCLPEVLRNQPPWSDFPLVVLAREGAEERKHLIRESMNATLVERPVRLRSLLSVLRAALRSRRHQYEVREHLEERQRTAVSLADAAQSNAKFRAFFEQGTNFAAVLSLDGTLVEANRLCLDACGFTRDDVLGKPFWECGWWNRSAPLMAMVRAAAGQAAGGSMFRTESAYFVADGAQRVVDLILAPVTDEAGRVLFVAATGIDITERKRMEDTLREDDHKKDEFIALLAHELRNPLAPIRNGLQVLRMTDDRDAREHARDMMDRQLSHMVRLIDDLLDVSRINRSKMALRRERIALADVVTSAVEIARPLIEEAAHELTVSLPAGPVFLDADLTRLSQVFGNLLTNSAKYTPKGGKIWLTAERRDREVAVSVGDTGIGIPADSLADIFNMFSQVDRSVERSTGGLGIGLALVKGLVEMHGGTITAASEGDGRGSTFTVVLPVVDRMEPPSARPTNGHLPAAKRILVVDDNRDGAESLAKLLRLLGNEVFTANDGLEAVEAAERYSPEFILMDVGMPRLNGLDATRRIREQPWGKEVTIIALTGWGQESDKERSQAAGCNGHLVKPVNLPELEKVLGERRNA
jgi:PAS domain S-box-containing protein